jgi:GNAT superfamily N-acetyltransferase
MNIVYEESLPSKHDFFRLFDTTGWNRSYRATPEELEKAIGHSWCIVSAYVDDSFVGFGRILSDGVLYATVCDLIVMPSYRAKRIGSAILKKLVERCVTAGIREIQLFSAAGTTDFYKKHGFVERPANAPGMRLQSD